MIAKYLRVAASVVTAAALTLGGPASLFAQNRGGSETTTPIKHVIVIFQENVSFDHYFATYPFATNPKGETAFHAKDDTPRVNNLLSGGLLDQNPNSAQPFRLDPSQSVTCDQNHDYGAEQQALDHGLVDKYPESTGTGSTASSPCPDYGHGIGLVMGYYDGNSTTAIWNYAQNFAMSDNSFGTMFGPSAVGALNLISGRTTNATMLPFAANGTTPGNPSGNIAGGLTSGTVIGDPRPGFDDCVATDPTTSNLFKKTLVTVAGTNVGDLLNAKGITWGWFAGGFGPTSHDAMGRPVCGAHGTGLAGDDAVETSGDYIPHHEPFQYYSQSNNQHHLPPSNTSMIGYTDQANHQYDLSLFWTALNQDRLPSVSYLKAKAYQDGHAGYSDPIDEQNFVVQVVNALENSPYWNDTAIIIAYDDSDGWYDHQMDPIVNQSNVSDDALAGAGSCGVTPADGVPGRCGYGPRLPLIVISPYAKQNYVDHRATDQSSILRFIEDNWDLGRLGNGSTDAIAGRLNGMFDFDGRDRAPRLILNPADGTVLRSFHF